MNWATKRVLITGAGGFIGSHLVERLVALSARTRAFVHYNSAGRWGWLDESPVRDDLEVVSGDIMDPGSVTKAMDGIDVVFHLAALIAIPYSYQAPLSYVRTNVEGTLNVLQAALAQGVDRVVHTSTSEVYGSAQYIPIDESHPLQGQSPYSATKIAADKLAEAFYLSFHLPVITIRPFNTFGPRQSARAIIPTIATQCLVSERVQLGNLHPTRDLNFVDDIVEAFVCAAGSPQAVGQVVNVGSGRQTSIGDLAQEIARLVGRPVEFEQDDRRVRPKGSEVEALCASNEKARDLLSWTPHYTLEEGLELTIDWIRKHLDRYRPAVYVL